MSISAADVSADLQKASAFFNAFQMASSLLPSIVTSIQELLPTGQPQDVAARSASVLSAALAWEGHTVSVIEAIWAEVKPIAVLAFTLTGNAPAAAIVQAIPTIAQTSSAS